ncbi:MAG: hypothetical protein M0R74_02030 [Dehalococcoidia bacterium]|nr:hypothetical protein [Dehalococcoidia bacterium]
MNQAAVILAIVVALVVVLGASGLFATRASVGGGSSYAEAVEGTFREPPADGSSGLVHTTYKREAGLGLFGWEIIKSRYAAQVAFVPPAGCEVPPSGEFVPEGACAGAPARGLVSGGGTTAGGHDLVIVSVTVSKACHEALREANASPVNRLPWPYDHPACRDD